MTRASGKARRWPDLLIGLLVVLLLAGFAFLLVGQRSQPVAQAPTPATPPTTETAPEPITIPTAPGTGEPGQESGVTPAPTTTVPPTTTEPPADQPTPSAPTPSASSAPDTGAQDNGTGATTTTETPSTTQIPVVPAAPIEEAPATATTPPGPATGEPTTPSPTQTPPAATPAPPPQAAAPVATSEQRTPLRSDYRVSLGSFATRRTAERLTQGVSDLGYTVYPIDLGDQVVAQIGPFPDEATARRALADIQRAYPGAVLYPPRGRSLRGDTSQNTTPPVSTPAPPATPSTGSTSTPAPAVTAPAPAPETPTPPEAVPAPTPTTPTPPTTTEPKASAPATPSGPVYLQLGAFDRVESAQDLVARLRGQGYAPTVNAPDGRKVTVLVGPFSGPALTNAETNLAANGHEFFRVR